MADRMHPYSMFNQNLTSNALQQAQIPQQPPQSQQPDPQMISALSNTEHARMWQLQNQLQNTYRSQQSGDLAAPQMNHQVQEFARGQALSHGQGQPIVQQIQQSFGLTAQRTNPSGPVFHDPQNNQPQLIPSNFSNMPMNTQQQMKTPFNLNPMMHAAMNPALSRLKMLPQDMARLQQPGLGAQHAANQPTAADMFSSASLQQSQEQMHGSPHPTMRAVGPSGANQGMVPGNQQQMHAKRAMTAGDFDERRIYLVNLITQTETSIASILQSARNGTPLDPPLQQKLVQLRTELTTRREVYNKFLSTFSAMVSQMANGMPSNMPHHNHLGHPSSQPPQQPTVSNAQVPSFQVNQPVTASYSMPSGNGSSPMPTQNQGALNQQIPHQASQIGRPNSIPSRTGGTPHQMPGGQLSATMSSGMGNPGGQKVPNLVRQGAGIMPLDRQRFESTYSQFCRSQNRNPSLSVQINERAVELHSLHAKVMQNGGGKSVTAQDMWAIIGGQLGIVQFPGNENDPPRCGPGFAQQLRNAYEQYLQHFEEAYVVTMRNRTAGSPQQPTPQMNPSSLPVVNTGTPPGMPGNPTEPRNLPRLVNQQAIVAAMRYAHASVEEMRAQQVHENMINFVDRYRPDLIKFYQQQLQGAKRNAEQERQNMGNASGQLTNMHEQASIGLQPGVQRPQVNVTQGDVKPVNASFVPDNVAGAVNRPPPTQDQIQQAIHSIAQFKVVFQQRSLPGMATTPIPEEQRLEYNQVLAQLYKMTSDLESRLHLYLVVFKNEELIRKYVAIVMTVARQQQLVSGSPPQYIINLTALRTMQGQIHKLNEEFESRWRAMKTFAAAANSQNSASMSSVPVRANPTPPSVPPMQNLTDIGHPAPQNNGRQVSINPSPQPQLQHPPPHPQYPQQPPPHSHGIMSHTLNQKSKPFPSPGPSAPSATATLASSTPPPAVASSSTPATSAPTPQTAAGSPQTPKSPPSKPTPKTKPTPRAQRKLSTAGKGPATPEIAPPVAGVKRPPEDDVATFVNNVAPLEREPSNAPSPKKVKTEWDGEPSEALVKKQQEVANIKTEDDATAFFDRMKELFAMSASNASTDNEIHHDIASTLDQILAGVAQEPVDAAATAAALSVHGAGDAGPPPTALSPHLGAANDAFLEFIDFSSFTTLEDEDNDSKAPTPDLVPSSEANPSPESGSEGDLLGNAGSPDKTKIEDSGDRSDSLRLGSLREIDGGESAYYQGDNWKWEGSMHTLDQQWAISNS